MIDRSCSQSRGHVTNLILNFIFFIDKKTFKHKPIK